MNASPPRKAEQGKTCTVKSGDTECAKVQSVTGHRRMWLAGPGGSLQISFRLAVCALDCRRKPSNTAGAARSFPPLRQLGTWHLRGVSLVPVPNWGSSPDDIRHPSASRSSWSRCSATRGSSGGSPPSPKIIGNSTILSLNISKTNHKTENT